MLTRNVLKQKLQNNQPVVGLFCSIPVPVAVEMIGEADFDFVIIDTEHVMVNPETVENMIRAAQAVNITALVRVSQSDPKEILKILDAGAQGIVVPNVESADEVQCIVAACKYFPEGSRSLNGGSPGAFGKNSLVDYMALANREVMVVPMIESLAGVEHITEILKVPGIDMVLEGAADLSQSCGLPWQISAAKTNTGLSSVSAGGHTLLRHSPN
jgi:staphyloferrin B biosynthesis citrate synthase